jgi:hypothetical protein
MGNVEKAAKDNSNNGRLTLIFDSIMVLCVDDKAQTPDGYNLQTFRIDNRVNFFNFRNVIHEFWKLNDYIENYKLYLIEDKVLTLIEKEFDNHKIDSFLKNRSILEKGQFIFINKSHKLSKYFLFIYIFNKFNKFKSKLKIFNNNNII